MYIKILIDVHTIQKCEENVVCGPLEYFNGCIQTPRITFYCLFVFAFYMKCTCVTCMFFINNCESWHKMENICHYFT